jgi:serine/threonine-protein kinase
VALLGVGAVILVVTGKVEARRARGAAVTGLGERFTWRNATLGGVGALMLWAAVATGLVYRGPAGASSRGSVVRLAVLPFENRGANDDSYFVDGVADQVRGKLMGVTGFEIIARSSSNQYKGSKKSPQEIGRELGVDFLLTSTVNWAKSADGKGRVQVVPELIDVRTGAGTWQQSFDAELTDIFQVQGSIASQVAGALNVALAPKEQDVLAERPTKSLEAYDYFLKGNATAGNTPAELRTVVGFYQQAVALDPSFAEAWNRLALTLARLYYNGAPSPEVAAEAKRAVEQLNSVAPQSALALAASSWYKYLVVNDAPGAIQDGMAALRLAPNDAGMLRLACQLESILGRWSDALAHAEGATRLDPKSATTRIAQVRILLLLVAGRERPEAAPHPWSRTVRRRSGQLGRDPDAAPRPSGRSGSRSGLCRHGPGGIPEAAGAGA